MRLFFISLLLLPVLGLGQDKPLAQAVALARLKANATNKAANPVIDLFTPSGSEKAAPTALSPDQLIHKLILNQAVLNRIRQEKRELLEISIPMANGSVDLALVPTNIFAPGFTVKTSTPDPNFTFDASKFQFYQGILNGNPNSIVTLMLTDSEFTATIADSTGNRVLAHKQDKAGLATEYGFYDERAVMAETRIFGCGVEDGVASHSLIGSNLIGDKANVKSSCPRYIGIYIETDYALYRYHNYDLTALQGYVVFLFNQVAAIYQNESIEIRLTQINSWTLADPYPGPLDGERLDQFTAYWRGRNNRFPGQLAHLISDGNRNFGSGGIAHLNSLADKNLAYGVTALNDSKVVNAFPVYSRSVYIMTHELGHSFGSPHTHSCGWQGGPIDNCAPVEDGTCTLGPRPAAGGGTIMSYCDQNDTLPGINLQNGFGIQPGNLIRNSVAKADLPSNDSVQSGDWVSTTTWACGQIPTVIDDPFINVSHSVQLNTIGNAKSLTIDGTLNLNTTNSILNITNN